MPCRVYPYQIINKYNSRVKVKFNILEKTTMKAFRRISPSVPLYLQVEEYLDWCSSRQSPATIKAKYWHYARLYQETGLKDLKALTNALLDNWLNEMAKGGAGPVALNRAMTAIKALVVWQREMNNLNIPIKLLLLKRAPVTVNEQTFYPRELIIKIAKSTKDETARLMIRIAFDTGMRASELGRLRLSNISDQKLTFIAKGGLRRTTYLSREVSREVRKYVKENLIIDYLFPGHHDGHIAYNTLRRRIAQPFLDYGISDFHPHALRHSFVADLERRGASVEELQAMIGHVSIKSTQVYQHRIKQSSYLKSLHKKFKKW